MFLPAGRHPSSSLGLRTAEGEVGSARPGQGRRKGDNRLDFIIDVVDQYPAGESFIFWCVAVYTQMGGGLNNLGRKYRDRGRQAGNVLLAHGLVLQERSGSNSSSAVNDVEFRRVGVMRAQGFPRSDPDFERWPYWFDEVACEPREFIVV